MSEASSEDLVPPLEAGAAPYREEEEAAKKEKKKSKGLANVFCVFTKGKKKKGQPSSAEPEDAAGSRQGLDGPPPTVEELKAALERGQLEAARPLLALERELAAAAAAGGVSEEELVRRQSKVEALYELLRDQVLGVLRRPLEAAPERLRQALAVVAEQEREDRQAAAAGPGTSGLAATRPRRWLQLWRRGVAEAAEERMGQRPAAGAEVPESVFLHLGRTMKEDLEAVVERLKPLFPAEFGVVAAYAESYHQHFAAHLAAVAQFELCERDTYMLLLWVQNLYPNDIINSPKLVGELQGMGLGSLLPPRQIRLLEATFLSSEAANVRELMDRALELEARRWAEDVPPQRLDGYCHSELAIDIIQITSQAQAKAESITLDLGSQIKRVLLVELPAFLRSYQRAFNEFLERGKQLTNYRANVIANINNCLSFRMSMEQNWQVPQDTLSLLLGPLGELKSHGFDTLLQNLHEDLKPLFKRFTHTRWAAPVETLENIIATVDTRLPEFSELQGCFREELMEALHLHLVKEYIIQLSKGRLVLKTAEQQQQLAGYILANADTIQHFCTQHGSPATWLQPALPTLAEIIRLQDPSAIKIEVATYATCYPDFSKGHLSAILAIKGNLSNSEVKRIRSILDVSMGAQEPSRPLFSLIKPRATVSWIQQWWNGRQNWKRKKEKMSSRLAGAFRACGEL
ncbi:tumor necrosis factor alpha-induced protein 2 [Pan paniscus]|uniref:tumor necrosis factor alpha-induced protein 2 n=1 Tax=Pan paniscus TaxID=9597 RepID=UPI002436D325|nr:tumor necrosis factor alpha-induced protein 2 [Pan paniscus]XP_034794107.2 tumor necrosis factor alpha-induced protein 2 [Pan paniscus]XP_034794108.2 tumor necrosis factor alpha-induced protein 2 [Pan paniscus]XP_054954024.1 tumor necrosis factor alpha-induced protein 2 [Pan paniscus]XP_054954025.1 tumor necrosis factor alpha-induced protein 2 [Pan paniscus]